MHTAVHFREVGLECIQRAKSLFQSGSNVDLIYAALELRMSMESVVYGQASIYKSELPERAMHVWQPRKLLEILLEVDPNCDVSVTIGAGIQEQTGIPQEELHRIGTDNKLNLATVKEHYDALGLFLHIPTLGQYAKKKTHDYNRLKERSIKLEKALELVFSSGIFHSDIGDFAQLECRNCGSLMKKRVTGLRVDESRNVTCYICDLQYTITRESEGMYMWNEKTREIICQHDDCKKPFFVREHELKLGTTFRCPSCNRGTFIGYGIRKA